MSEPAETDLQAIKLFFPPVTLFSSVTGGKKEENSVTGGKNSVTVGKIA